MLRRDFAATLASNLLTALIGFGTYVIFLNVLKPEGQGLFALACFIPSIVATFCGLGQDTVNATLAGLRKEDRSGLFVQSILVTIFGAAVSVVVTGAYFFWLPIDRGQFGQLDATVVWLAALIAPVTILAANLSALVRGVGKVATSAVLQVAPPAAVLVLAVVLLVVMNLGLTAAVIVTVAGTLIGALIPLWFLREYVTLRPSAITWALARKSLAFGLQICMANFAMFLVYRVNQGIMGYMGDYVTVADIGLFAAAVGLAERLRVVPGSLGQAFLPRLANELAARQAQVPSVFRYSVVISVAAMLAMAAAGVGAILLVLRPEYRASIAPFLILLPGVAALGGASILSSDFLARGKPYYAMAVSWGNLCVNVILNLLLIPVIGIAGAALTSTICYVAALVASIIIYRRESGVRAGELVPRWADCMYVWRGSWDMARQMLGWVLRRGSSDGAPPPAPPPSGPAGGR